MQRIKKRKKSKNRQIIGIIILSFSILLAFGGITGSKFLGELGGYIQAHFLLFTFGYPVLIVSFLLFLFGWFVFFGKRLSSLFSFSAYSLIFMCLLSYGLSYFNTFVLQDNPLGDSFHLGGNIGVFLADKSNTILGVFGSIVIILTVFA
ncbi:DNA translocase FtsK 4TM domain-containing protein, partial [bacterium]|nr:DNA translocase FtsK 4TM domain-containing protein [bacterium]